MEGQLFNNIPIELQEKALTGRVQPKCWYCNLKDERIKMLQQLIDEYKLMVDRLNNEKT